MRGGATLPREAVLRWMVERRAEHAGYYGTRHGAASISPIHLPAGVPAPVAAEINRRQPHPGSGEGYAPLGYHEVEHDGRLYGWWVRSSGTALIVEVGAVGGACVWFTGRRHSIAEIWPTDGETGRPIPPSVHWYDETQRSDLLPFEVAA